MFIGEIMRKIIIDTDPGCDDGIAILAALAYEDFDILGITCVAGNKSLPVVVPNALRLVDFKQRDIPVCKGAHNCLEKLDSKEEQENLGVDFHGKDGMGESGLPYTERCLIETPAWDFILEKVKEYPNEIELITLGPLTNIALAIQKDIETMKQLKSITIMGGSMYLPGNTTKYAEYNIWFDALSAQITVDSLAEYVPIKFVGQDATHGVVCTHKMFDLLSYEGGQQGILLEKIARTLFKSYFYTHYTDTRIYGAYIHDLYTVLSLIDPSIIQKEEELKVKVLVDEEHKGQTYPCEDGKKVMAVLDFDEIKLKRLFLNLMMPDKKEMIEKDLMLL